MNSTTNTQTVDSFKSLWSSRTAEVLEDRKETGQAMGRWELHRVAKESEIPIADVIDAKDLFDEMDCDRSGVLDFEEFHVLANRIFFKDGEKTTDEAGHALSTTQKEEAYHERTKSLRDEIDADGTGYVDFKEFLHWYSARGFTEDMLLDKEQRFVRNVARKHGMSLVDVEGVKAKFDCFDDDKSGVIDQSEFSMLLRRLMKIPAKLELPPSRVRQFWSEVDTDGSGEVDFEEFLLWYSRYFSISGFSGGDCPISEFYKSVRKLIGQGGNIFGIADMG